MTPILAKGRTTSKETVRFILRKEGQAELGGRKYDKQRERKREERQKKKKER